MWGVLQDLVPSSIRGAVAGCVHIQQWTGDGMAALGFLLSKNGFSYDFNSFHVNISFSHLGESAAGLSGHFHVLGHYPLPLSTCCITEALGKCWKHKCTVLRNHFRLLPSLLDLSPVACSM